jgi:hypothetical protein
MANTITEETNYAILKCRRQFCIINLQQSFTLCETPSQLESLKEVAILMGFYKIADEFQQDWNESFEATKNHERDAISEISTSPIFDLINKSFLGK